MGKRRGFWAMAVASALCAGCGDDGETEADRYGVGAECSGDGDCLQSDDADSPRQSCLTQFKGGYCGIEDCTGDQDCPDGSACVAHDDGTNYCFRICRDKPECNANRGPDAASNCSANIAFVENQSGIKACVPPSG